MKRFSFKMLAVAAAVCAGCWLGCGGGDNGNPADNSGNNSNNSGNNNNGGDVNHDGRLICGNGEAWVSWRGGDGACGAEDLRIILTSDGVFIKYEYDRGDGVWWERRSTWRTEGNKLIVGDHSGQQYEISDGKLKVFEDNRWNTLTKCNGVVVGG